VLCLASPWPGLARTVWGDHRRFKQAYFSQYPGCYFTGDGCRRDEDGYYWITERIDDVLNVSGHRFGTAEIESALVTHEAVAEAAVVGFPHPIREEGIYAYVLLTSGQAQRAGLRIGINAVFNANFDGMVSIKFILCRYDVESEANRRDREELWIF
jgi:acetyl-CoA synthetase